jgi:hypothetical protein
MSDTFIGPSNIGEELDICLDCQICVWNTNSCTGKVW